MCKDSFTDLETSDHVVDVLIIGAGPCGLAVASRIREKRPSALFTDVEQARYSWVKRNKHRTCVKSKGSGRLSAPVPADSQPLMLVLDSSGGQWMTRWKSLFERLDISHLRSPMFFHPDPSDRDALLAFVHQHGGLNDAAQEIAGCVGRELSKHQKKRKTRKPDSQMPASIEINERDRRDYFAPTSASFDAFCKCCIERYGLEKGIVQQQAVVDIQYGCKDQEDLFTVHTAQGHAYQARAVVLALGAGPPNIPAPFTAACLGVGASHAMQLQSDGLLSAALKSKLAANRQTRVLVIGGGLTSAQVAVNAVRAGVSHVDLIMRGPLKGASRVVPFFAKLTSPVKSFDVDLAWMSKFQNHERAIFWSCDSHRERMDIIAQARNGGSITPRYVKKLRDLEAKGRLAIHTHTTVKDQSFDSATRTWSITLKAGTVIEYDHVYFATGVGGSIKDTDCLKTIQRDYPVQDINGLPVLTDDLQWCKSLPLFVTGRYASLELGPGAGNLEGARLGAERIAWKLDELRHETEATDLQSDYISGIGSMYKSLCEE